MLLVEFESVKYSGERNHGYCVYVVKVIEPDATCKCGDMIEIVGNKIPNATGLRYLVEGEWRLSPKYGEQLHVNFYEDIIPPTRKGIIGFLTSGRIEGITPAIAELVYAAYRNNTMRILDDAPQKLKDIPGIASEKYELIVKSYAYERIFKKMFLKYKKYGINERALRQAYSVYGKKVDSIISNNPYVLSDFGVSIPTLDLVARDFNVRDLTGKAEAVILESVKHIESANSNVCSPNDKFVNAVNKSAKKYNLSGAILSMAESNLLKEKRLIYFDGYVYRRKMHVAENEVAKEIYRITNNFEVKIDFDIDLEIKISEKIINCKLHVQQKEAVKAALRRGLLIITGGPGTGKTVVIKVLRNIFERVLKKDVLFLAPTGRAAGRMKESSGYDAFTIHKHLLISDETLEERQTTTISQDCTVCDEASMIDMFVALKLLQAIPDGKQLILIGDVEQLPSVGPGAVLKDMINSGFVPTIYLTKVFRQSSASNIYINCRKIVKGNLSLEYGDDFIRLDASTQKEAANLMAATFVREVDTYGLNEVCCLCPFRKSTETGVNSMNSRIQKMINPPSPTKPEIEYNSEIYRLGDRIMNLKNGSEVCNGDLGYIVEVGSGYIKAQYGNKIITYSYDNLDNVTLAYAMTVHKSQGSEFSSVVSTLLMSHGDMLQMNLFNTAVSRASKKITIVGNETAIKKAILNRTGISRFTRLSEKIILIFTSKERAS